MHGAVSAALDRSMTNARRRRWSEQGRTSKSAIVLEITPKTRPLPMAEIAPDSRRFEEVLPRERYETLNRALNVVIALVALVCLAPVMLLVALAIKLTSEGPVFYSQIRVGMDRRYGQLRRDSRRVYDQGGKPFRMFKFRTMHVNAEADGRAVWAQKADPRVTLVGRVLRRTRLDELPQLLNVVRGEMNIVGPRPERPTIFADLREGIPDYPMRQRVKPGITGWAQINQAYDVCVDDVRRKVEYDLEYVQRQGLLEDLRIMTMTLPVMLFRRGGW